MTPPAPTAAVLTGGAKAKLSVDVFGLERNDALVHHVVTAELAARRQGTHSTKTRGLVAGGRSKPWRQKGTGRARQGTTRAPQWTGGGVAFGPSPRNYTGKVNKKERVRALRIALSSHAAAGSLRVIDGASFSEPKTAKAAELFAGAGLQAPVWVVVAPDEVNLAKSVRNLDRTYVANVGELDAYDVVMARSLLISKAALATLQGGSGQAAAGGEAE
jgi:large subunit ribosomal protein L4